MVTIPFVGLCLAFLAVPSAQITPKKNLTIGGIFDIDTDVAADSSANMIPAVKMALKHVNEDPNILKDYHINLEIKDVKCKNEYSIKALIDYMREDKQKIMIIGPGCSESAEPFAKAVHFYNLIQISMANANPALGCKKIYKTFVRTVPPEHYQNMGRVGLIQKFDWHQVGIVQESLDTFLGLANDLVKRLKKANISIVSHEIFKGDGGSLAIENLKRKDARIMFGMFRETTARQVMCQAYKQGMCGPKYVWVLMSGSYRPNWWTVNDTSCTPEQVREGLGNYFGTKALLYDGNGGNTIAKRTIKKLEDEYLAEALKSYKEPNPYASFAYDAVWTAALALQNSLSKFDKYNETKGCGLEDFTYENQFMADMFLNSIKTVSFQGMSGNLIFDKKFERLGTLQIEQLQDNKLTNIGMFCMVTKKLKLLDNAEPKWQGQSKPVCHADRIQTHRYIEQGVFYFMSSFCAVGILMAVTFLVFNVRYSHIRYIKMSSPRLNNIILTGCILIYASGIAAGVDGQFVSEKAQKLICQVQAWMVSIGFTLAFGALFSKTWRVHVIFLNKTERKVIKDHQLFGLVVAFLVIDVIVLICWQVLDPLYVTVVDMMPEILKDGDAILLPQYSHCTCKHMTVWTGILYGYKGFLLVFGTYLAWETRKVSIAVLNDSKTIGISIYNVIVPCILVIPILHVIKDNVSIVYGMMSLLCVLCTTVTQCLIFVPKVMYIMNKKPGDDDGSQFSTLPAKSGKNSSESNMSQSYDSSCSSVTSVPHAPRNDAYSFKGKDEEPPLSTKDVNIINNGEAKQNNA
ncbi:gamma-aminobutyric acid type B receptor subunit 2-like [Exaiptasia diaphana]|uniref:Gamma-aminobutyric acid type B receptor subunit 2 n=1 Tax=Exaiptasia diaphana TaxID=2652724 RepID=A0A913Y078_EXADI|nr:gamma-aminobutyric acid type B receptor subunit 2-like [Exaiptasia diaphana]